MFRHGETHAVQAIIPGKKYNFDNLIAEQLQVSLLFSEFFKHPS